MMLELLGGTTNPPLPTRIQCPAKNRVGLFHFYKINYPCGQQFFSMEHESTFLHHAPLTR